MSIIPERDSPKDYVSVLEFSRQYRVDVAVVRSWIKHGYIPYVFVGPRMIRRIRKSDILKPIEEGADNGQPAGQTAERTGEDAVGSQTSGAQPDPQHPRHAASNSKGKGWGRGSASGSR